MNSTSNTHRYQFEVKTQNQRIIGSGTFKTEKELEPDQQLAFFHEFTNNAYWKNRGTLSIYIDKVGADSSKTPKL